MKKILVIVLVIFGLQTATKAQCGVNYKETLKKCEGIFLIKKEFSDKKIGKWEMVLKKGNRYSMYFLNPNKDFPKYSFEFKDNNKTKTDKVIAPFADYESKVSIKERYTEVTFTANLTGLYILNVDFEKQKDACILWAFYFRGQVKVKSKK